LLAGGDDYELCFTAPPDARERIAAIAREQNLAMTKIGSIEPGTGLRVLDAAGNPMPIAHAGYDHFK